MTEKRKSRRMRGEGSIYQRHDHPSCPPLGPDGERPPHKPCYGTWVGQVDLGWVDGKRKRPTVYGKTQAEVVRKIGEKRRSVAAGDRTTSSMTTEKWLHYWLDKICPTKTNRKGHLLKPKTLTNYRSYVEAYLIPSIGRVKLDKLTPQHVRNVHAFARAEGRSSTTAHHAHTILGTALNDAVREGVLVRNVVSLVASPALADNDARALTLPEVGRYWKYVAGDRLASRWHFGFLEGTRQGETLGLRWSMLDLERGVVDIAWQLQRIPYRHGCTDEPRMVKGKRTWACGRRGADRCPSRELDVQPGFRYEQLDGNLCLQRPKTGDPRLLPLPEVLVLSLQERYALYLAERDAYLVDHDLVWCRPDGRPIDAAQDRLDWHANLAAAGVPDADQHAMRHTTSTLLLELGVSERERMAILGHSEAATNRLYTHVDMQMQSRALQTLGGAVAKMLEAAD